MHVIFYRTHPRQLCQYEHEAILTFFASKTRVVPATVAGAANVAATEPSNTNVLQNNISVKLA